MKVESPIVNNVEVQGDGVCLSLHVPENLHYFKGHFQNFKLLPGVVQVHWAMQFAKQHLQNEGRFCGFQAIKFMKPIPPGCDVSLQIELSANKKLLNYRYSHGDIEYSSGKVTLEPEELED